MIPRKSRDLRDDESGGIVSRLNESILLEGCRHLGNSISSMLLLRPYTYKELCREAPDT